MGWPRSQLLRTSFRVTITVSLTFAVLGPLGQPMVATFATFSSVALLLFANYSGSAATRVRAYAVTTVTGAAFVLAGSLAASAMWVAVPLTFVVAFAVQTASVLGGAVAKARMPLLLAWILPVTLPATTAEAPWRVLGWLVGGAVSLLAALVLWPDHGTPGLRAQMAARAQWLLGRLNGQPDADGPASDAPPPLVYRPFGTTVRDHELHRAAESLAQLTWFADDMRPTPGTDDQALLDATVDALQVTVHLVEDDPAPDYAATLQRLVEQRDAHLRALVSETAAGVAAGDGGAGVLLDRFQQVLPLRMGGILAIETALHAELSRHRPGPQPYLGGVPGLAPEPGAGGLADRFLRLIGSALAPGSVWLRVSLRVAVGVTAAVLLALVLGVEHGFWVALGTLSVLRSTALSTGRTYLLAVVGTLLGFVLSSGIISLDDALGIPWLLQIAFPVTIFLSAYAPPAWHFVAGQAAFTMFVVVMFTLLEPSGLATGITRIEDVVLGGAVSVVTGALLWPFGTRHRLRSETSALLRSATVYLSDGLQRAIRREQPTHLAYDRDALQLTQWRAETALQEYSDEQPDDAAAWTPALDCASRLRLVGDMLERAAEFRAPPPAPDVAGGLAPAADGVIGGALLVSAELESARRLRLTPSDGVEIAEARRVALAAITEWGGDVSDAVRTWDTVATAWTYVWLRWTHHWTTDLAARLDGSPLLEHPVAVRA